MSNKGSWDLMVGKFQNRLSKWKARMLSIGGRLTLVKSVLGSLGIFYFSIFKLPSSVEKQLENYRSRFFWGFEEEGRKLFWVQWNLVLNNKDQGGLSVGSLKSFNQALLYKWRWRFLKYPNLLWVRMIKSCYGSDGGFDHGGGRKHQGGVWSAILKVVSKLHETGALPLSTTKKKVGDGSKTRFWIDEWCGDLILRFRFPRLFELSLNKQCLVSECREGNSWQIAWRRRIRGGIEAEQWEELRGLLDAFHLSTNSDTWSWELEPSGEFTISSVRRHLDFFRLPSVSTPTLWNKFVPIKVNVFAWRIGLNRLPTRKNLDHRGIDLDSILCPCCEEDTEDVDHLFFKCSLALQVWRRLDGWISEFIPQFDTIIDMYGWIDSHGALHFQRAKLHTICLTLLWVLWTYRNVLLFGDKSFKKDHIFDSIVSFSYNWFCSRNRKVPKDWNRWMQNPMFLY